LTTVFKRQHLRDAARGETEGLIRVLVVENKNLCDFCKSFSIFEKRLIIKNNFKIAALKRRE
jgi:hypothetical protein